MNTTTESEVLRALGRLEGKVDILLDQRKDHDVRLGKLERWRAYTVGIASTVAGLITLLKP